MTRVEVAEKIVYQGSCDDVKCTECPANKKKSPKENHCDFCRNFTTNESAIQYFEAIKNKAKNAMSEKIKTAERLAKIEVLEEVQKYFMTHCDFDGAIERKIKELKERK